MAIEKIMHFDPGLLRPRVLGDPISVASQSGKGLLSSWFWFLMLSAAYAVNLTVLSLIPLPIFDGGQILYLAVEGITGRRIPDRLRRLHRQISIGLLIVAVVAMFAPSVLRLASG